MKVEKLKLKNFGLTIFLAVLMFTCSSSVVSAHRYHTTLTRMDFNEKEKLVEITTHVFLHDLIPTLERKNSKKIDLDKKEEAEKLIFEYLQENFILRNKNGQTKSLKWVGWETKVDSGWLYFETEMPEGLEGASLQNTLFFESFAEQSNLVICKYEGKKADLAFKVGDKFKEIKAAKPDESN